MLSDVIVVCSQRKARENDAGSRRHFTGNLRHVRHFRPAGRLRMRPPGMSVIGLGRSAVVGNRRAASGVSESTRLSVGTRVGKWFTCVCGGGGFIHWIYSFNACQNYEVNNYVTSTGKTSSVRPYIGGQGMAEIHEIH